jgi:hypothetical protein
MAREIKRQVANCVLYTDGCIRVDGGRLSYPHLAEPWSKNETDKKKYSATVLCPKETHQAVKELIKAEMDAMLIANKTPKLAPAHKFLKDGDQGSKTEEEGNWVIKASENPDKPPALRNRKGQLLTPTQAAAVFQPGVEVRILLKPWFQNNQHGKKINANLIGVQFVADDGTRFGEGAIEDEEGAWDPLDDDNGDMSLEDDDDDL